LAVVATLRFSATRFYAPNRLRGKTDFASPFNSFGHFKMIRENNSLFQK
jgi:hypothetical protein